MSKAETDKIIQAFGGLSAMSRALGHKHVTTVHGWKVRGRIPSWRWPEIREAAEAQGIELPPPAIPSHTRTRARGAA